MPLPLTDNFVGTDGDPIAGRTTTTGGEVWVQVLAGTDTCQINTNRFYGGGTGGVNGFDAGSPDIDVSAVVGAGSQLSILFFRSDDTFGNRLEAWFEGNGRCRVFDQALNPIGGIDVTVSTIGDHDEVEVQTSGNTIVLLVNGTQIASGTSSVHNSLTWAGIRAPGGDELFRAFGLSLFAPTVPTLDLTSSSPSQIVLDGTSGSQGTGPYTYQQQVSTTPGGTFTDLVDGSGVSGATTLQLTLSAPLPSGVRYYRNRVRDTLSADFFSNEQSATVWKTEALTLGIGDSIMAGFGNTTDPLSEFAKAARGAAGGQRVVQIMNRASGGTKSSDWFDAAGSGATSLLIDAVSDAVSAGLKEALVMLGANNAFSAETNLAFQADMAGLSAYCLANGLERVFLNYPTAWRYDGSGSLAKVLSLQANIDAVCNGVDILKCDTLGAQLFQDQAGALLQDDGSSIHPNDLGDVVLGGLWAYARSLALGEVSGGGGVSGARIFGGF